MAEITSVTVARAAVTQADARNLRERQEQERLRQDQARQAEAERKQKEIEEQLRANERELRRLQDENQVRDSDRRDLDAQDQSLAQSIADDDFAFREARVEEKLLAARDLDVERREPPLTPRAPVSTELTPEEVALTRRLDELAVREPPEPLPAAPDRFAPLAGPDPFDPLPAGAAAVDAFELVEGVDEEPQPVPFESLERERTERLAERRDASRDNEAQQRLDLEAADERIANARLNPDLPPGSIVDVLG